MKRIQVNVSEKNYIEIRNAIDNKSIENFDGTTANSVSSVASFFIDIGIKVFNSSSSDGDKFDIDMYREEVLKRILQSVFLGRSLLQIVNEIPEFKDRNLISEFINNNNEYKNFIDTTLRKYFKNE